MYAGLINCKEEDQSVGTRAFCHPGTKKQVRKMFLSKQKESLGYNNAFYAIIHPRACKM